MKIAIISDIHDNLPNLDKALRIIKDKECSELFFAGDLNFPPAVQLIADFEGSVHMIWGNNEGEKVGVMNKVNSFENVTHYGNEAEIEIQGLKIFMTHYPEIANLAVQTNRFDLIIYGHTHEYVEESTDNCKVINPGALLGYPNVATFAIFDTETKEIEKITL